MASVKVNRNFNSKHLTKGDPVPPFTGKLRVYNMRLCPFGQRIILALNAKNIDYEIVNVDLLDKPEWLPSKSSLSKVPALEVSDGVSIYESLVTVEYLEDAYPQRPLFPKDPLLKAKDKLIVEAFSAAHGLYFKLVKGPDTITKQDLEAYFKALDIIQTELQQRGTKFLDGEEPGYADYMIWPWFERLLVIDSDIVKIDEQKYKLLLAYLDNLSNDPVIVEYKLPKEAIKAFQNAFATGQKLDYDAILNQ